MNVLQMSTGTNNTDTHKSSASANTHTHISKVWNRVWKTHTETHLHRNNHTHTTDVLLKQSTDYLLWSDNDWDTWRRLDLLLTPYRGGVPLPGYWCCISTRQNAKKRIIEPHSADECGPGVDQPSDVTEPSLSPGLPPSEPTSDPFAWRARTQSWIFIKCNATPLDCQPVAPSHMAILNLWKIYHLWAQQRPPFHFLTKHTWENRHSVGVCVHTQEDSSGVQLSS